MLAMLRFWLPRVAVLVSLAALPGCRRNRPEPAPAPVVAPAKQAPQATGQPGPGGYYRLLPDLRYGLRSHRQVLDLFIPREGERPLPVVVFFHGGGWNAGDKQACPAPALAAEGFAVACANYRLSQEAPFPAQIHDAKAAVRWVRANAPRHGLDARRIAAWGYSAGGHIAALLGTSGGVARLEGEEGSEAVSSRVQAAVDWFGPTDFLAVPFDRFPLYGEAVRGLVPGLERGLVNLANPGTHATPDDPPLLVMHGTHDDVVPISQSEALFRAVDEKGGEVEYHEEAGAGHGEGFHVWQFRKVITFLRKHLK